ncbi:MAG TPA: patatin-like phospholipase family protein [Solirubrobacteraceae bacterium]|nr:patatin-like phospholipase family protein [Solirubrobacteraceae bacterium]
MADSPFLRPDVLVLASGGTLGEAWMSGMLAGIEDATGHDFRSTEALVGTSAGALIAAALVAGERPRRPRPPDGQRELTSGQPSGHVASESSNRLAAQWLPMPRTVLQSVAREAVRLAGAAATPLAPMALAAGANGSTALRAALLGRAPGSDTSLTAIRERVDRAGARFDGRLRIVAVDRANGRRVVFGAPGAPAASVAEAVQASCSVPWIFAPVQIQGREYVDGGVWSNTNLDTAPAGRATQVLCLNPIASLDIAMASPFGMLRAIAGSTAALETLALRSRGAKVRMLGPAHDIARVMAPNLMDVRRREEVLAGAYAQGLEIGGAKTAAGSAADGVSG